MGQSARDLDALTRARRLLWYDQGQRRKGDSNVAAAQAGQVRLHPCGRPALFAKPPHCVRRSVPAVTQRGIRGRLDLIQVVVPNAAKGNAVRVNVIAKNVAADDHWRGY